MIINICDNRILYFIWLKYSILYFYKINNVNLIIDLNNNDKKIKVSRRNIEAICD